jgi:hypothetical protein
VLEIKLGLHKLTAEDILTPVSYTPLLVTNSGGSFRHILTPAVTPNHGQSLS